MIKFYLINGKTLTFDKKKYRVELGEKKYIVFHGDLAYIIPLHSVLYIKTRGRR